MVNKNNKSKNIKSESKDNNKVIYTFNKNGSTFQEVMKKSLIMKLNSYYSALKTF